VALFVWRAIGTPVRAGRLPTEVKLLQVLADGLEVLMAERLVPELDELQRNPRAAAACTPLVRR
jgi:hypothetical protein